MRLLANYFRRSPAPAERKRQPSRLISDRLLFSEEVVLPKLQIVCQEETEGPGKNPVAEWTFFFVAKAEASKTYAGKSEEQGL